MKKKIGEESDKSMTICNDTNVNEKLEDDKDYFACDKSNFK